MITKEIEAILLAAEEANKYCNFESAEKLAREAIQHLEEDKKSRSNVLDIHALLALSQSLWQRGLAKDALPIAEQALTLSEDETGSEIKEIGAKAIRNIGIVYCELSEYTKALKYFEKALAINEELGNKVGVATQTGNIGNVFLKLSQYAKALKYFEKALALHEELGNKEGVAKGTGNIGIVNWNLSEYAKALKYFEKALALHEELGNKVEVAAATRNIGVVYNELSQYSKSLEYYEKALALDEELGNKAGVSANTSNIGNVYYHLSQYAKALEFNEKSLALDEELGNKAGVATQTHNIGNVYINLSEYAKALEYYEKSLKLSEEIGYMRGVGFALSSIGEALGKIGRNKEAIEYLQRSLHLSRKEIKSTEGVARVLIMIGTLLAEDDQFAEAIQKLEEGLALAEKLDGKKEASEAHKELAEVYDKIGDVVKALEHFKEHYTLDKEIFSDDTRKRIEIFNIRIAIADKELKSEKQKLRIGQLEHQLTSQATQLVTQTELLAKFRDELREIVRQSPSHDPTIRAIKEKLKELPCKQIDWEKFEAEFKAVHPEFSRKLNEKFSTLTPTESKMCTLLRLNLKSHEIARLFCLSERSIETHRFNIRKKLGLERERSLSMFLNSL